MREASQTSRNLRACRTDKQACPGMLGKHVGVFRQAGKSCGKASMRQMGQRRRQTCRQVSVRQTSRLIRQTGMPNKWSRQSNKKKVVTYRGALAVFQPLV